MQAHIFVCINSHCLSLFWALLSHIHFYEAVLKLGGYEGCGEREGISWELLEA